MNQIKIGKFIAERRKERGFLQKDIAARMRLRLICRRNLPPF